MNRGSCWKVTALLACALVTPAFASASEEPCNAWFPDLNCGRSGTPDGFFKPIVQPYLFEDPFITTDASLYYLYHDFPESSALQGGGAHAVALQLRVALTERIAIIATKDGYIWNRPGNPLLQDTEGFTNIALGVKGLLYEAPETPFILSGVLRFEADTGSTDTFQGQGDGIFLPSLSAAYGVGPLRLIGDFGAQIPVDSEQSTALFAHLYAGLDLWERFQPFAQVSWLGWIDSGDGSIPIPLGGGVSLPLETVETALGTGAFEGADVFNLGSSGSSGLDLWTAAVGGHLKITERITFTAAYERSISSYQGIFQQRFYANLTYQF